MSKIIVEGMGIKKSFVSKSWVLTVLKGIDLQVTEGEMVGIFGPSGSGKSTLLYLLSGLDRPTEGKVFFDGQEISNLSEEELFELRNQKIGFLFQFHYLLPEFTALENVMLPLLIRNGNSKKARERAKELLAEMEILEKMENKPEELSGGEKQRVSLARALIGEPTCLFLDEPTGNLDAEQGEKLLARLKEWNEKRKTTMLIVSHNEKVKEIVHRIYYLKNGRITESKEGKCEKL